MPSEALSRRKGIRLSAGSTRPSTGLLVAPLLVLLSSLACASNPPPQAYASTRDALADLDEFGALLVKAGLPTELLPQGRELSPEQATQLRLHFHLYPPKPAEYAPWLVADVLLLETARKNETTPRAELGRRIQAFQSLVVLRPDGYLASALSGRPEQCVGPVEVKDGAYRAGGFEVGGFYQKDETNNWQPVAIPSPSASR